MNAPASVRETHSGLVLLIGDHAYKLKKPVHTPYLDFRTPQRRLAALRRELELNRRLAPRAYLGIARLSAPTPDGRPDDVEQGEPVLVMRRMPDAQRLATLVGTGAEVDLRPLARLLAAFHAGAGRSPDIDADGAADALTTRWTANLTELACYRGRLLAPDLLTAVTDLVQRFLAGRGPLLADRVARGRIVDGHGDLLAEDVFLLPDGPQVLDCLEFDDRLRHVDVLDDVTFLAMDLERLGHPELAERFLDHYVEFSADPAPPALRHHYTAYRAVVRAKVAGLRHDQGDPTAASVAVAHTELALRHLRAGEVRLVLVGGLPGTGKTTVAHGLADRLGAVVLSSDRVRKELAGLAPEAGAGAAFRTGLYSPERTDALYSELLHRAEELLGRGETVVLDASWTSAAHRGRAVEVADRTSSRLVQLRCHTEPGTAATRISHRAGGPSDATPGIAAAMAATADPWAAAVTVPTSGAQERAVQRAVDVCTGSEVG